MKKQLFLSMILTTMVIATSCKKDDPIDDPIVNPIITHAELQGQWNFVEFELNGNTYYYPQNCGDYGWYNVGEMENWDIGADNIIRYVLCMEEAFPENQYELDLKFNEIHIIDDFTGEIYYKFKILEYDSNTQTIRIKKTYKNDGISGQLNGILTMQKQ